MLEWLLKPSAGCGNPDKRTDTDTDIRPPGPRPIRILADTDIRISAGYPDIGRYPVPGRHPDAHRHPADTGRYPDAHRHPGTGRYRPTRPSSLKGLTALRPFRPREKEAAVAASFPLRGWSGLEEPPNQTKLRTDLTLIYTQMVTSPEGGGRIL